MEPEDQELIKRILDQYSWQMPHQNDMYGKAPLRSRDRKVDLSDVDTRDLLNECYRRRAIEKFNATRSIDSHVFDEYADDAGFRSHVEKDILQLLMHSMQQNQKFFLDAVVVKESKNRSMMRYDFEAELFMCKHPTKVRK